MSHREWRPATRDMQRRCHHCGQRILQTDVYRGFLLPDDQRSRRLRWEHQICPGQRPPFKPTDGPKQFIVYARWQLEGQTTPADSCWLFHEEGNAAAQYESIQREGTRDLREGETVEVKLFACPFSDREIRS